MMQYIITLKSDADYDATVELVKAQGGQVVDESARILGIMTVQIPDPTALKSLTGDIDSIEPDQVVKIQQ